MSPLDDIPAPWRDAMEAAGTHSLRALAARAGAGTTTVSDLIYGRAQTSESTLQNVADALRLPITTIRAWASSPRGELQPFELPPEANRLTRREREAILAVVRAMLQPGEEAAARAPQQDAKVIDLARPPAPDLSKVAARRGDSEGRRLREAQDEDADPEGPSDL